MKIEALDHIGIEVRDLDLAEPFYRDVLGLEAVARFHNQALFRGEGFELAIFENPGMHPMGGGDVSQPLGKGHWAFRVSRGDLTATEQRFSSDGVAFHAKDWGDYDCLYFADPDGNLLEIVAYR